jgi:hypothetical protein
MFRMPVSGIDVELRRTTGEEDLLLLEAYGDAISTSPLSTSMMLAERLAVPSEGGELDAASLTVADLEALLLEIRRRTFGDVISTHGRCGVPECDTPIDLSFRIGDYLRGHRVRKPVGVQSLESEPTWFQLRGGTVEFRLVTTGDLAAAMASEFPELELARLTMRSHSPGIDKQSSRRAQRAMESLAPPLSGEVQGECPECGAAVRFWFDVQSYVQRELRYDAEFLYEDVHQLATRYHWSEEKILSLPRQRRMQYVEMAMRQAGGS